MKKAPHKGADVLHQEADDGRWELARDEPEAVRHMREAVRSGKEWPLALLEAVGMWTLAEEEFKGRGYNFLLEGEAFDWLLLAERLCYELDGVVPLDQKQQLLFHGILPNDISDGVFRELVGFTKHQAILNYWYGVVVEEALQLAVEEEVRKQHRARSYPDSEDLVEEAFRRLYEDSRTNLLTEFFRENGNPEQKSLSLTEMKEFTYRLFKRRVKIWDPARVGSDTRKGLVKLHTLRSAVNTPTT